MRAFPFTGFGDGVVCSQPMEVRTWMVTAEMEHIEDLSHRRRSFPGRDPSFSLIIAPPTPLSVIFALPRKIEGLVPKV